MQYDEIYTQASVVKDLIRAIRSYQKDSELKLETVNGYGGKYNIKLRNDYLHKIDINNRVIKRLDERLKKQIKNLNISMNFIILDL